MIGINRLNKRKSMQISFNQFNAPLLKNISSAVSLKKYQNSSIENAGTWKL